MACLFCQDQGWNESLLLMTRVGSFGCADLSQVESFPEGDSSRVIFEKHEDESSQVIFAKHEDESSRVIEKK